MAFSPDGRLLAIGDSGSGSGYAQPPSGRLRVWDPASERQPHELGGPTGVVSAVAFSPDGRFLAYGDHDRGSTGRLRVWDLATGRQQAELSAQTTAVTTMAFSPDGQLLATGDGIASGWPSWGRVRVWEVTTGRQRAELGEPTGQVNTVAFSPDGRLVASGDNDGISSGWLSGGRVRVWELTSRRQQAELASHTGAIVAVAFSPDGRLLTSADNAGVARIWRTDTYTLVATMIDFTGGWAVLLPDGSYKLAGDPGRRLWWAMKLSRFEPGEFDDFSPSVRRLDPDTLIPGLERYR